MSYSCIVADPPWPFGDKLPGRSRGAEKNYRVMSIDDICNMRGAVVTKGGRTPRWYLRMCGREHFISDDALLFLWRVSAMLEEALRVVRAWGFVPKSEIVWIKTTKEWEGYPNLLANNTPMPQIHFGMGRYVRAAHETCIIAARGKAISLIQNRSIRSVFFAPTGKHSQKPEEFYAIVENLCVGPRLELFARRSHKGWTCAGDELRNGARRFVGSAFAAQTVIPWSHVKSTTSR